MRKSAVLFGTSTLHILINDCWIDEWGLWQTHGERCNAQPTFLILKNANVCANSSGSWGYVNRSLAHTYTHTQTHLLSSNINSSKLRERQLNWRNENSSQLNIIEWKPPRHTHFTTAKWRKWKTLLPTAACAAYFHYFSGILVPHTPTWYSWKFQKQIALSGMNYMLEITVVSLLLSTHTELACIGALKHTNKQVQTNKQTNEWNETKTTTVLWVCVWKTNESVHSVLYLTCVILLAFYERNQLMRYEVKKSDWEMFYK